MPQLTAHRLNCLPDLIVPGGGGFQLTLAVAAGYDPGDVASWAVAIYPRHGSTRTPWTSTTVDIDGQVITLDYAADDADAEDAELTLADVIGVGDCTLSLTALDAEGAILWRVQGNVTFAEESVGAIEGLNTPTNQTVEIDLGGNASLTVEIVAVSDNGGHVIHAATSKTTPVDADELGLADSAASFGLKKLTWANLKATLKTYFDTLYAAAASLTSISNALTAHIDDTTDAHAASAIGYTPADNTDWTGSADPGHVDDALDQLADRVKTVEGNAGSSTLDTNTQTSGLSGLLKSEGDTLASAVAGTDYLASIPTDGVSNTHLANMAEATVKGRAAAAGTGDPQDLTGSQVRTICGLATTDSPSFSALTITGGGNALNVTGNVNATGFSSYPYFTFGFPNGDYARFRNAFRLEWDSTLNYGTNTPDVGIYRNAAGRLEINSGVTGTYRDLILRNLTASGGCIIPATFTEATLPTASSNTYGITVVTDASAPSLGATVAGGGSAKATVQSDGTNWKVIAVL